MRGTSNEDSALEKFEFWTILVSNHFGPTEENHPYTPIHTTFKTNFPFLQVQKSILKSPVCVPCSSLYSQFFLFAGNHCPVKYRRVLRRNKLVFGHCCGWTSETASASRAWYYTRGPVFDVSFVASASLWYFRWGFCCMKVCTSAARSVCSIARADLKLRGCELKLCVSMETGRTGRGLFR